jgi:hypothetical protein
MKSSKAIKYLEDMCWSDPSTVFPLLSIISCALLQNLGMASATSLVTKIEDSLNFWHALTFYL